MSKEQAMNVLGLGRAEGKKKPKQLFEYSEDDLLTAFRAECSSIGECNSFPYPGCAHQSRRF